MRFSIFGFPARVDAWFWVTAFLLGGGLRPEAYAGIASIAGLAIWAIVVFLSIMIHELGHASVGRRFGAEPEIVLHAFGGMAVMHHAKFNRMQDLMVTAAGPLASIILGTISLVAFVYFPDFPEDVRGTLLDLIWINYFWTLINLLPIQPLDGGLLLRTALGDKRLNITCMIGFLCAAAVAVLAFQYQRVFLTLMMAMFAFENWRAMRR